MKLISLTMPVNVSSGETESINFTVSDDDGKLTSEAIVNGHRNFAKSVSAVSEFQRGFITQDTLAETLIFNAAVLNEVQSNITRLGDLVTGRMTLENGAVYFDGDRIDETLNAYILRLLDENGTPRDRTNWEGFVKFLDKMYSNVNQDVREQLFGWLQYQNMNSTGFTITSKGNIIGYKGCTGTVESPMSINSGVAVVNDVRHNGRIPNNPGSVVEMPRSSVENDPKVGCATGLHIGTYNYAKGWSHGVMLRVEFSPADVVSVPFECSAQKARVCRYTVLEALEGPENANVSDAVYYGNDENCEGCEDYDCEGYDCDGDECPDCDCPHSYCDFCGEDCPRDEDDYSVCENYEETEPEDFGDENLQKESSVNDTECDNSRTEILDFLAQTTDEVDAANDPNRDANDELHQAFIDRLRRRVGSDSNNNDDTDTSLVAESSSEEDNSEEVSDLQKETLADLRRRLNLSDLDNENL